jgi:hypothetical protein
VAVAVGAAAAVAVEEVGVVEAAVAAVGGDTATGIKRGMVMNQFRMMVSLASVLFSPLALGQGYPPPPPPPPPATAAPPAAVPGPNNPATEAMQISQARQKNLALLHNYTWNRRVEVLKNGSMLDQIISQESYLPNGQLQKVVLNDEHAPLPGGFIRRAAAENKINDAKKYAAGLKELFDQYTLPSAGAILNYLMVAKTTGPDSFGNMITTGSNVVVTGDSMTMWVDAKSHQLRKITVTTTFQGDYVTVSAVFAQVPNNGPNYLQYAEITVPSKNVMVLIQNYNYYQSGF